MSNITGRGEVNKLLLGRHDLRARLGLRDSLAAEVFALTVFLCDGLLQLNPALVTPPTAASAAATTRFFSVASKLSLELQMILCQCVVGSTKQSILHKD